MNKPKILVVDDREENLIAMKRLLETVDAQILTAASGNDALALVLEHAFALILLDVQMPDMDGFETAEMIRLSEDTAHIPIIFVTAISKEQRHVFKGYESGAVDYMFKPVEGRILLGKVEVFLVLYRQRQELQELVGELRQSKEVIKKQNEILARVALHDELTGLFNRRHLNTMLEQEFYRCKRYGNDLAVMMLDLDHFKSVNDTHGHGFGDLVLKEFAQRMQKMSRPTDLLFRFGGEEFIILLPQTDHKGAIQAGEHIRSACAGQEFCLDGTCISVTTSIGVASFHQNKPEEAADLVHFADQALYQAKHAGRNAVISFSNTE